VIHIWHYVSLTVIVVACSRAENFCLSLTWDLCTTKWWCTPNKFTLGMIVIEKSNFL